MSQKSLAGILLIVLVLVVLALLLAVFAFGNGCCSPDSSVGRGKLSNTLFLVAEGMLLIGLILDLIGWIGALFMTLKKHQWGWFLFILFFNWLAMLIYLKMQDDASVAPALYKELREPNDKGMNSEL